MKTSPVAVVLALLAVLVLGTAFASPALAHDTLKSSDPAKGAKVESLKQVKLTFSASVRFPNVVVHTADNVAHQDGKPVVDGAVVTQALKEDLPPGKYVIAYRVVSSDGHPIEGEIPFTLVGSPSATPSETVSESPAPAESATAAPAESATPAPAATGVTAGPATAALSPAPAAQTQDAPEDSGGVPGWMWLIVGGVTGVGIGLFFSMRNKKQP
ncbi:MULTISPECIES: copper resistance CopC family protein [Streptosporangium]|uniref:Methionine-rich copper-binding protein CopC n=1 Tax=Streptosporangium brasiliense TaxID=47480 RepID=A0ABT9QYJ9_9ACTN|nr:copper resistance CopC family protein [Streptosporangium brasiliense]MDP9861604.1 methionine-rich copper-binding protein CopC [Streptosporangium brasiliense]